MKMHNEKPVGIRKELNRIIQDDNLQQVLEAIVSAIDEASRVNTRLSHLYNQVRPLIPARSKYNEQCWLAAYILYYYKAEFKGLLDALQKVTCEIKKFYKNLDNLEKGSQRRRCKGLEFGEYMYLWNVESLYELQYSKKAVLEEIKNVVIKLLL